MTLGHIWNHSHHIWAFKKTFKYRHCYKVLRYPYMEIQYSIKTVQSGVQLISLSKSTMIITIAITIFLLRVAVAEDSCDYGDVVQGDCPIENCCDLGYGRSPFALIFNKPKVYDIKNFCGNRRSILKGYCDTITDGGGWIVI